jgi:hypothetical protein
MPEEKWTTKPEGQGTLRVIIKSQIVGAMTELTDTACLADTQPSTLIGGGKSTVHPTLQEAMKAWHRLPPDQARQAAIRSAGDRVYTPIEFLRLHHKLKTT